MAPDRPSVLKSRTANCDGPIGTGSKALGSRARPGTRANPMLFAAVGAALALQLAGIYLPVLQDLLGTEPPAVGDLLIVGAAAGLGYAAIRIDRLIHRS